MERTYTKSSDGTITLTLKFKPEGDMMDQETALQIGLQEAGRVMMEEVIKSFDTNGAPIVVDNERHTSRGLEKKLTKQPLGK
jgi:hypothetical protein